MELPKATYPPSLRKWIDHAPEMPLGPGEPVEAGASLREMPLEAIFEEGTVHDAAMARCCLAGLLLRYNWLKASHALSQSVLNATGSYWHGIMHRREPDYGNAKYWFQKAGSHPIFPLLANAAHELNDAFRHVPEAGFLSELTSWSPGAFVDLCENVIDSGSEAEQLAVRIQREEWDLLMAYSYLAATTAQTSL